MNKKLKQFIERSNSVSKRLYKQTEIGDNLKQSDPQDWPEEWKRIHFKSYPRLKQLELEKPSLSSLKDLSNLLLGRNSERSFAATTITKRELSTLLFFSVGIKESSENWDDTRRVYPSAGARYPSEIYLVVFNSKDIEKGLYHYNVKSHSLELLLQEDYLGKEFFGYTQEWARDASVVIIVTSVLGRSEIKYGARAYRYCLIEAGHIGQNFYLVSTALGLKCCAMGGFVDKNVNKLLDLDDGNEFTTYLIAIGS